MEVVIAPAAVRDLLLAIARADTSAFPPTRPGSVVTCEGISVARRALSGAWWLRCFRGGHGVAPAYAALQAALRALTGPPAPCPACGGGGWFPAEGRAAQEAAWAALAFGGYRGIRFPPLQNADEVLRRPDGLLAGLGGGCSCVPS